MTETPEEQGGAIAYIPALDGLRGLAILLVIWCHTGRILDIPNARDDWFWRTASGGTAGVDLFFGVSGFLITTILLQTRDEQRSLLKFWARRALRIFPLHYLYLVVLVVLSMLVPGLWPAKVAVQGLDWIPFFLYVGNIAIQFMGWVGTPLIILWSLAVEEQFYLVWPFVTSRISVEELGRFCIAGIVLSPFIRLGALWATPGMETTAFFTLCRVDPIFYGALLAVLFRDEDSRARIARWAAAMRWVLLPAWMVVLVWTGSMYYDTSWLFETVGRSFTAFSVGARANRWPARRGACDARPRVAGARVDRQTVLRALHLARDRRLRTHARTCAPRPFGRRPRRGVDRRRVCRRGGLVATV